MNLDSFTLNGEWVIISKLKFKFEIFRSLRFRLCLIVIIAGLIPTIITSQSTFNSMTNSAIDGQIKKIQTQSNIIVNQLTSSGYFLDENMGSLPEEKVLDIKKEISGLAGFLNGRILVVDSNCRILVDTYVIDEKKILLSESLIEGLLGNSISKYDAANNYIEVATPIIKSEGEAVKGALLVYTSTDSIEEFVNDLQRKNIVRLLMCMAALVVAGYFVSGFLVKPFKKVSESIQAVGNDYLGKKVTVGGYAETRHIAETINDVMGKLSTIESARQEFVSNVSHELKTPITSMKVLADSLLADENAPAELYREFMEDIVAEIDRENRIINELLALVKMDKSSSDLNINVVTINDLLELIIKRLHPIAAEKNVEMVLEYFRPVTAEIDEMKLTLAFTNLIENAIKYNVENGWVHVSLDADHQFFTVTVSDSGIGIPEESINKIYERFYRVDKSRSREIGGTGLGLAITRSAILMHRGAIKVASKENEGTTFTVRIPLIYIS